MSPSLMSCNLDSFPTVGTQIVLWHLYWFPVAPGTNGYELDGLKQKEFFLSQVGSRVQNLGGGRAENRGFGRATLPLKAWWRILPSPLPIQHLVASGIVDGCITQSAVSSWTSPLPLVSPLCVSYEDTCHWVQAPPR